MSLPRSPATTPRRTQAGASEPRAPSQSSTSANTPKRSKGKGKSTPSKKVPVLVPKDSLLDERLLGEDGCSAYLYREAAVSSKQASCVFNVGWMYYHGLGGCPVDPVRALEYFEAAGRQDHDLALYYTGELREHGAPGVAVDPYAAIQAYAASASHGCPNGAYAVGNLLLKLRRTGEMGLIDKFERQNPTSWFEEAAAQGHELSIAEISSRN